MLTRICALLLGVAIAVGVAATISTDEPAASITLQPGANAVTWSGSEPYAIADFADTPVTQIHRFDAMRQKWLSHSVGQTEATLPELHLLPRVQYLLMSDKAYELTIPNPLADTDPLAELRFPPAPDDPLRFEAYWPNEDSPLEDLILLRPDDERLSVEAWVAGGVGDVSVYWFLDGQLNHQGAESDDVELLPGKHDNARLFATDEMGQVIAADLPRVVKLPQVEIPEMVYGINEWYLPSPPSWHDWIRGDAAFYATSEEYEAAVGMMADLGVEYVRFAIWLSQVFEGSSLDPLSENSEFVEHFTWLLQTMEEAGVKALPILGSWNGHWAQANDITNDTTYPGGVSAGPLRNPYYAEALGRAFARRWPQISAFAIGNEPNITQYRTDLDPRREMLHQKMLALGIWYENPDAIIVAGVPCCMWEEGDWGIHGLIYLEALYQSGFGPWHDVVGIHLSPRSGDFNSEIDVAREIMARYGDGDKPLWGTETPARFENEAQYRNLLLDHLRSYTDRDDMHGIILWKFRDTPGHLHLWAGTEHLSGIVELEYSDGLRLQPSGIAVRDFLRAQRERRDSPPADSD